ncbi:MAG TPA: tetratricopeptide repeat protein [Syntrophales bacterium]|nr:tetratricopeptide repeat protein [Syntrophales bacterium]
MASLSDVVDRKEFVARAEEYLEQDPARAVDLALERLRIYPDDMEAKIILGIGWYRKGEMEPALEVLRGIAEDVIRWAPAFSILSELSRERGLDDVADQASRIFMSLNPESPEAIANLEDRLRRESQAYPEPGNEKPDEDVGLPRAADFKTLTLADLYARQGYRELAEALLKEILASDPDNQEALERLQKLRPHVQKDVSPAVLEEGVPAGEGKDLFFGDPVAHPFHRLFGQTIGMDRIEPGEATRDAALEPKQGSAARNPREAAIGELSRWLASLDRMKGNA